MTVRDQQATPCAAGGVQSYGALSMLLASVHSEGWYIYDVEQSVHVLFDDGGMWCFFSLHCLLVVPNVTLVLGLRSNMYVRLAFSWKGWVTCPVAVMQGGKSTLFFTFDLVGRLCFLHLGCFQLYVQKDVVRRVSLVTPFVKKHGARLLASCWAFVTTP